MSEKDLLDEFKKILMEKGVEAESIKISEGNKSKNMDFNFIDPITGNLISLEAKTFLDTRTNSNFFLSLFGKILKGRYLNSVDKSYADISKKEYGFLFYQKDRDKINKLMSVINSEDWLIFCKQYDLKYIYFVNDTNYVVEDAFKFKNSQLSSDSYFNDNKIFEENEEEYSKTTN